MSRNLVEFMRIYEKTSASGNRYITGRLGGLRLVGFHVEATGDHDAHIQLYVDASPREGSRSGGDNGTSDNRQSRSYQRNESARQQSGYGAQKGRSSAPDRRGAFPGFEPAGGHPEMNDEVPF